jgi:hypothetical protein
VTGTFSFSQTTTLRARNFMPDGRKSQEIIGTYTLVPVVAGDPAGTGTCGKPTWSFSGSLRHTPGNLTLTNTTSGATIKYRFNAGATTNYSSPILMDCGSNYDIVEYWATKAGMNDSSHGTVNNTLDTQYGGGGGRDFINVP